MAHTAYKAQPATAPSAIYKNTADIRIGSMEPFSRELAFYSKIRRSEDASGVLQLLSLAWLLEQEIQKAESYSHDWDSYGAPPPTSLAANLTRALLNFAISLRVAPTTIVASAEGGIAIYFLRTGKSAYFEFRNTGQSMLVMYDDSGYCDIFDVDTSDASILKALEKVRGYIES